MWYKLIAAVSKGGGIGHKGHLPWSVPEDLQAFRKITMGDGHNAVVMGRATWLSLQARPLPGRHNIVLTTSLTHIEGADVAGSVAAVDRICELQQFDQVWVMGGAQTYRVFLEQDRIDVCVISRIDAAFECDVLMPRLGEKWLPRCRAQLCLEPYKVELHQLVRAGLAISPRGLSLPPTVLTDARRRCAWCPREIIPGPRPL